MQQMKSLLQTIFSLKDRGIGTKLVGFMLEDRGNRITLETALSQAKQLIKQ